MYTLLRKNWFGGLLVHILAQVQALYRENDPFKCFARYKIEFRYLPVRMQNIDEGVGNCIIKTKNGSDGVIYGDVAHSGNCGCLVSE
jgi:hypothetical protein